ncbi:MAG: hypothetical protein M3Q10_02845, partial [Chloroflexota bacterium]|nr:hypothetical protein [Chloroflexota bacterium]
MSAATTDRTPPPAWLRPIPENFPAELLDLDRWLTWEPVWREGKTGKPGAWTKEPRNPRRPSHKARSNDPATWGPAPLVVGVYDRVGFALEDGDGYAMLDADNAVDGHGRIKPWGRRLMRRFPGGYWEISPSRTGLKGLVRAKVAANRVVPIEDGKVEVFGDGRYTTLTGHAVEGSSPVIADCQDALDAFLAEHGAPVPAAAPPREPAPPRDDDDALLERALNARNGAKVRSLWAGDVAAYDDDHSRADEALVSCLCFWTADDAQVDRLFRRSGLYREKWQRSDYRERTLRRARSTQPGPIPLPPPAGPATPHHAAPAGGDATVTADDDPCAGVRDELAALRAEVAALRAQNADLRSTVDTLRSRVALADEQLAIHRNPGLGAQRAAAAALAQVFRVQAPVPPDRLPEKLKDRRACYRVPLPRLADQTNLSDDAVSRQTKTLATYSTPDGSPVLIREVVDVPGYVDQDTGEIIAPHKELWLGPGPDLDPATWGGVVAKLDPAERKAWGGKADRNACPDHPAADVVKRTQLVKRTRLECAVCHRPVGDPIPDEVLKEKVEPVAQPTPQDAATTTPGVVVSNQPRK